MRHVVPGLISLVFLSPFLARALEAVGPGTCATCKQNYLRDTTAVPLSGGSRQIQPSCLSQISTPSGKRKAVGEGLVNLIKQPRYQKIFFKNSALTDVCPRFAKLKPEQKLNAWVWLFADLANQESNCTANIVHPTTVNGVVLNPSVGYGLWALNYSATEREGFGPECAGDIEDVRVQERCAVHIMSTQVEGRDTAEGRNTYWGPLRINPMRLKSGNILPRFRAEIEPNMHMFKECWK